jgi:oligopeptide transport system substrate-binding protein
LSDGGQGFWTRRTALLGGGAVVLGGVGYEALRPREAPPPRYLSADTKTLHRGNGAEPLSLDPAYVQGEPEENVTGDLMVSLMTMNPAGEPIPGMAESWTTTPDGLTWVFKLRDAQWSDGVPVTAEDFVLGWQRLLDPKSAAAYAYYLYVVKNAEKVNGGKLPLSELGVRARDARTLEVTLEHPAPYFLEMMTHMTTYPVPRHVVSAKGKDWIKPGNHVSNGPFMMTEWKPRDRLVLMKNPRFYDATNVVLERVIFYPTDDYAAALQRMRAGELDTQSRIPAAQVDWIRQNMPEIYDPVPQFSVEYVVPNCTRKPFDDVRVRAAINLAISREAICNKIRRIGDVPAYSIVPPGMANYPGEPILPFKALAQEARVERARALMREAGFGPNRRLKTTYMIRSVAAGSGRAVAAAMQQMLAQAYIDVTIIANDFPTFLTATSGTVHDFDICQPAWGADFNDASNFLDLFITNAGNNWGLYSNREYDALMAQSRNEVDIKRRAGILAQAETILLNDHAVAPLWFWVTPGITRPYVKNWVSNPLNAHRARWVTIDGTEKSRTRVL